MEHPLISVNTHFNIVARLRSLSVFLTTRRRVKKTIVHMEVHKDRSC